MKKTIILFCLLYLQISFGQKAFIHAYYGNCDFFKDLTQKEIKTCVSVQKDTSGFKVIFKIPITKDLKEFVEIKLTTYDTQIQKYGVGHDASEWIELGKDYYSHTGYIEVNFQTKCAKTERHSGMDSSGFIELTGDAPFGQMSGYFRANVNGFMITGAFKNIIIK